VIRRPADCRYLCAGAFSPRLVLGDRHRPPPPGWEPFSMATQTGDPGTAHRLRASTRRSTDDDDATQLPAEVQQPRPGPVGHNGAGTVRRWEHHVHRSCDRPGSHDHDGRAVARASSAGPGTPPRRPSRRPLRPHHDRRRMVPSRPDHRSSRRPVGEPHRHPHPRLTRVPGGRRDTTPVSAPRCARCWRRSTPTGPWRASHPRADRPHPPDPGPARCAPRPPARALPVPGAVGT